jgi:beta-N-acetylhexosaminidase
VTGRSLLRQVSGATLLLLALAAAVATGALSHIGGDQSIAGGASPTAAVTAPSVAPTAPTASPDRELGQMIVSHVEGLAASPRLLARVRAGQVGAVILFSENVADATQLAALTASLQGAAAEGHAPPLLIGVDQEGGPVKRISFAPPTMSAAAMGQRSDPRTVAFDQGQATGTALRRLGINLDFAPVADTPVGGASFLGERAFSSDRTVVAEAAGGFATGLSREDVAGVAKHFPGLGGAGERDTDTEVVQINLSAAQLRHDYAPYRQFSKLGSAVAPIVMISNAIYPALDPTRSPATLSRRIVVGELALAGMSSRVTITDDLEVPAVARFADAPLRAALAGNDMLMFAQDEQASERAYSELRTALAGGALPISVVHAAAERIDALKRLLVGAQQE